MKTQTIEAEIREQLNRLPLEQQHRVLEFARSLATSQVRGVSGKALLRFAGTVDAADLTIMKQVIEEGCERIDHDEW
ncbi:MAG: hypothetical protein M3498_05280 [Deinococcota bacterium]|nr:hypothetical protein [Deinococcota bacterium]